VSDERHEPRLLYVDAGNTGTTTTTESGRMAPPETDRRHVNRVAGSRRDMQSSLAPGWE